MSSQENKMIKNAKRHEKIGTAIFVIFFTMLSMVLIAIAVLSFVHESTQQITAEIAITSNVTKSYYNGSDSIVAVLLYKDGSVDDDHVFTYTSDHPSVLRFETSTRGEFIVIDKDYRGEVGIDVKSSLEGVMPAHISIEIVSPPDYSITLDYNGSPCDSDTTIAVWAGEIIGNTLPRPTLENYEFQGWYPILADGSMDTKNAFNHLDRFFWGRNLTIRARFKSYLQLDDDMGDITTLQDSAKKNIDVFFNEPLFVNLPKLSMKNGWQFDGWYSEIAGGGNLFVGKGEIFNNPVPVLYSKWVSNLHLDSVFSGEIDNETDVTYHSSLNLPKPVYHNGGIFMNWYLTDGGKETLVSSGEIYCYGANATLTAKVKFPIRFDYQGATDNAKEEDYFAIYKDSLSSMGWDLPHPENNKESGWLFEGWYTQPGGEGEEFTIQSVLQEEGVLTLYAKRTSTFKLYRQLNELGKATDAYDDLDLVYNASCEIPTELTAEGWCYDGFWSQKGGEGERIVSQNNYIGAGEQEFYAKWTRDITFETPEITPLNAPDRSVIYKKVNVTYKQPVGDFAVPTYENGGEFEGWYSETYGNGNKIDLNEPCLDVAETRYVHCVKFPLNFDYQSGTDKNGKKSSHGYIIYGKTIKTSGVVLPEISKQNNWTFSGWYSSAKINESETDVSKSENAYKEAAPLTIYARWTKKLILHREISADGRLNDNSTTQCVATYNNPLPLDLDIDAEGWEFGGWYADAGGKGDRVDSASFKDSFTYEGDDDIYAKWDTVINFHVSLDLLGDVPKPVSVTFKSEIPTLPVPIYKDGGEFAGWFTSEFGQGTPIDRGTSFTYEPGLKVFDKVEFTICVDYQDASSKNGGSDKYTAVYGRSLNDIGIKVPDPIKNNWEFAGWYTNPSNEDKVLDSTAYTFTSPITVFARWTRNITLDTGISELANETLQATYGRKLTLPRNAGDDAYWGTWRFDGWYTQRFGQETKIENQEAYFDEEYTTLYANWVLDRVTLIFNNADKTDTLEGIIYGKTISESTGKNLPQSPEETGTRDGYYYATGWRNQNNDDAILVDNNTRKYPQVMSALYLRWEPKEYTITLDPNGGIQSGGASVKVKMGDRLPDHIAPTREGIDFEGYYTIDGRGPYYTRGADNQMLGTYWDIPDDTTLIAKWETTYEISLLNFEGGNFKTLYVALNKKLPNISAPTAPKGYSFGGYYAENNFSGQPYYDMNMSCVRVWDRSIKTTLYPKPVVIPITVSSSSSDVGTIPKSGYQKVTINVNGGSGEYDYKIIGDHSGITASLEGNILTLTWNSKNQKGKVTVQVTDKNNGETATIEISYATGSCLAEGTLITLADGSQKAIEDLSTGDMVMSWNFFTGEKCAVPVVALWYHGTYKTEVVTLNFENGASVRMVAMHGFFDYTLNEFVFLSSENCMSYIGDEFVCDGSTDYATTKLKSAEVSTEEIGVYSILTAYNYNAYAEGMLSLTPSDYVGLWASFFDMGSDMKFDKDAMQADIEKYGLFTYSEWSDFVTEQEFEAFGGAYFKILIGKGVITYEQLYELLDGFRSNPEIRGNDPIT